MISLIRVDDRLIHGQVQTNWIQLSGAKNVLVIDDRVRGDDVACQVLRFALPSNMKLKILNVEEASTFWEKAIASPNKILVLFKSISACYQVAIKGCRMESILVGPVCFKDKTTEIVNGTYFNDDELLSARALHEQGVEIVFQQTPDIKKIYWENIQK